MSDGKNTKLQTQKEGKRATKTLPLTANSSTGTVDQEQTISRTDNLSRVL
jgi:hypothetical protein